MHEPQQVLIAIIRKDQVLREARKLYPSPLDIFSMPSLEHIPAPVAYESCRLVEMDSGRFAICCAFDVAGTAPGKRVLVLRDLMNVTPFWFDPPRLVPVEKADTFSGTLPVEGPDHQIIGAMRGEFIAYD